MPSSRPVHRRGWGLGLGLGLVLLLCHLWPRPSLAEPPVRHAHPTSTLSRALQRLAQHELGVPELQRLFDHASYEDAAEADDALALQATRLARRLENSIRRHAGVARKNRKWLQQLYLPEEDGDRAGGGLGVVSCCDVKPSLLRFDARFGAGVNRAFGCHLSPSTAHSSNSNSSGPPSRSLEAAAAGLFKRQLDDASRNGQPLKWQYFISRDGHHVEFPASRLGFAGHGCGLTGDTRHQNVYLAALHARPKHLVILLDRGRTVGAHQLDLSRAIVQYVLATLSDDDQVSLVALADTAYYPLDPECRLHRMAAATESVRQEIAKFINVIQPSARPTNHSLGLKAVRGLIRHSREVAGDAAVHVLYLTRGHLDQLQDQRVVLEELARLRRSLSQQVVINCYVPADITSVEEQFLRQVSVQDFSSPNLTIGENPIMPGHLTKVSSTDDLGHVIGDYFRPAPPYSQPFEHVDILPNQWDPVGAGMVVSFALPVFFPPSLSPSPSASWPLEVAGVTGLDVGMDQFLQDFIYFSQFADVKACLVEKKGRRLNLVFHPDLYEPGAKTVPADLLEMEPVGDGAELREQMLSQSLGSYEDNSGNNSSARRFNWVAVASSPFISVIISQSSSSPSRQAEQKLLDPRVQASDKFPPIFYHRLERRLLKSRDQLCRSFRSLSTLESGTLYLSPTAFASPDRLVNIEAGENVASATNIPSYMAYLTDRTRLIANPGLKPEIRPQVSVISQITSAWKDLLENGSLQDYVVRRYAATPTGIFYMFPGGQAPNRFNFLHQKWFKGALDHPGKLVLTGPRLDATGSGYIVTLSQTVFRSTGDAGQGPDRQRRNANGENVVAVAAIDLTLGYFHKLIYESHPHCKHPNTKCFLFDDAGYLISHPIMFNPTYIGSIEEQHLNHKEPLIGQDLLNHPDGNVAEKKFCHNFASLKIQRFYQFNTSLVRSVTNTLQGHNCYSYNVSACCNACLA